MTPLQRKKATQLLKLIWDNDPRLGPRDSAWIITLDAMDRTLRWEERERLNTLYVTTFGDETLP